mgnify:CR=1 FL=1
MQTWVKDRFNQVEELLSQNKQAEAARDGLDNLTVITADMNAFEAPGRYDRIVSVEMFEHVRNHRKMLLLIQGVTFTGGHVGLVVAQQFGGGAGAPLAHERRPDEL